MEDLFKKFVNAGVGYIAQGSKTVQKTIDKLVQDNKMTQDEGKKIVDELLKSGETKRAELEKQFQGLVERAKSTVGLADAQPAAKGKAAAKKPAVAPVAKSAVATANSVASKAAGTVKKVADRVSAAADSAQKSTAAKAAVATQPAAKPAPKAAAKVAPKAAAKPAASKPAAKKTTPAAPAAEAGDNA